MLNNLSFSSSGDNYLNCQIRLQIDLLCLRGQIKKLICVAIINLPYMSKLLNYSSNRLIVEN